MAILVGSVRSQSGAMLSVTVNTLLLCFLLCCIGGVSSQGLILVPDTVTRELGGYYLSKLGLADNGINFYSTLAQRNAKSNAYIWVNDVHDTETPREAAAKLSNVRGVYTSHNLGGKVKVESFYRLLRCELDERCSVVNRLVIADVSDGVSGTTHALAYVKTSMGNTGWLINAPQTVVNGFLTQSEERQRAYVDEVFKTTLFYKVATRTTPPCSSSAIQTLAGTLSQFARVPGFACINYGGTILLVGTTEAEMITLIKQNAVPAAQCDGSLGLIYTVEGPRIVRLIRTAGAVPLSVFMDLPIANEACVNLYETPELTIRAARAILDYDFEPAVNLTLHNLPAVEALGFGLRGKCLPTHFQSTYALLAIGQNEALTEGEKNTTYTDAFVRYNPDGACVAMMGVNKPTTIEFDEDRCAQLFLGNPDQQTEGVVTYSNLPPYVTQPATDFKSDLQNYCANPTNPAKFRYKFDVAVVLPQISADFETDKNFLVASTEVNTHLDGVAANAASVLAVEAALATSGIVIARTIARTGLYRRRRLPSNVARGLALFGTAVVVTLFNIPNFALINRSLSNHGKPTVYTQASLRKYRPTNFTAVILAETHSFVEVTGSSATAVVGLLLYGATLIFCLYLTWEEFTEIIHRREAAESRLGQEALIADKDLLVQWRGTDSLVYDTLHPKKVVESAHAQELEYFRRNLAYANPGQAASPRGGANPRGTTPLKQRPGTSSDLYPESRRETPDLYPDL